MHVTRLLKLHFIFKIVSKSFKSKQISKIKFQIKFLVFHSGRSIGGRTLSTALKKFSKEYLSICVFQLEVQHGRKVTLNFRPARWTVESSTEPFDSSKGGKHLTESLILQGSFKAVEWCASTFDRPSRRSKVDYKLSTASKEICFFQKL